MIGLDFEVESVVHFYATNRDLRRRLHRYR